MGESSASFACYRRGGDAEQRTHAAVPPRIESIARVSVGRWLAGGRKDALIESIEQGGAAHLHGSSRKSPNRPSSPP